MPGLIWIRTVLHSDSVVDIFFIFFFGKKSDDNKSMKIYSACKELSRHEKLTCGANLSVSLHLPLFFVCV